MGLGLGYSLTKSTSGLMSIVAFFVAIVVVVLDVVVAEKDGGLVLEMGDCCCVELTGGQ